MRRSRHGLRRTRTQRRKATAILSGSLSMPALHTKKWRRGRAFTSIAWQRVTQRPRGKPSSSVSSKKRPDLKPTSGKWAGGSGDLRVHGLSTTGVARVGDLTLGGCPRSANRSSRLMGYRQVESPVMYKYGLVLRSRGSRTSSQCDGAKSAPQIDQTGRISLTSWSREPRRQTTNASSQIRQKAAGARLKAEPAGYQPYGKMKSTRSLGPSPKTAGARRTGSAPRLA